MSPQRRIKCFTYRNFPHRLLLAAAGISSSPITLSSVTHAPETAHNPATVCTKTCSKTAIYSKKQLVVQKFSLTFSKLTVTSSAPSEENRSWLNDYLRKASLNLIRQSVASVSTRERLLLQLLLLRGTHQGCTHQGCTHQGCTHQGCTHQDYTNQVYTH